VLPETFARDSERLARFKREAQMLAALNHASIAGIHSLEEANGVHYLVLEFVPGETLAKRLKHGTLEMPQALGICRQIAEALEAAHEKGPKTAGWTPCGSRPAENFTTDTGTR
jgi:eukaryotic-like serine/threonine-protein kinase